jgi:hypothetical protein
VEENIEKTLTFYRLPREHHKHLKSTNTLERLNQELKRRTHVIRIFPNEQSALRLIRPLAVEIHEDWIEAHRYLNMEMLREQRKQLQLLEAALRECDGLFTNRLLWLGRQRRSHAPTGLRLPQPCPAGAFENKPNPSSQLLPDIPFAELDARNTPSTLGIHL